MTVLEYKDFQGSVEYDQGKLLIRLLHIDDTVVAECDSAAAARDCFEALVDDYLETCAEIGRKPSKPFKGTFNVRVKPALHRKAAMSARRTGLSLNAFVERAIIEQIEQSDFSRLLSLHAKPSWLQIERSRAEQMRVWFSQSGKQRPTERGIEFDDMWVIDQDLPAKRTRFN